MVRLLMPRYTLDQAITDYLDYCQYYRQLRPVTLINYADQLKLFARLMPEILEVNDLTPSVLMTFFKRLHERERIVGKGKKVTGVKASTVESYWNRLSPFCEWLVTKDVLPSHPLKQMRKPKPEYTDRRKLTKSDIEKILSAVTLNANSNLGLHRDYLMVFILLFTGLRKSELLGLQVRDVDRARRILTIRGETSKSKKTRLIPINQALFRHLSNYLPERKAYTTPSLIVSTLQDRGLSPHGLKHWVKRLRRLSGVRFHIHQFRHTFACNLGTQNASAIKIQKLMGHTDLRMTQRYLRSMGVEDLREEINQMTVDNLS